MRVLLVIHGLNTGGAESMVRQLASGLRDRNVQVTVASLTTKHTMIGEAISEGGSEVLALDKRPGLDVLTICKLRKLIKTIRPDIVHSHLPVLHYVVPAILTSRLALTHIHTFHSVARRETRSRLQRVSNALWLRLGRTQAVALTPYAAGTVETQYRLRAGDAAVIPNGTELSRFKPSIARSDETFSILHVGRLHESKNHEFLLHAFALFLKSTGANSVLTLVGEGELRARLEQIRDRAGLTDRVIFAGDRFDVERFYEQADVFVLPSRYEGFPMTLIEAMAAGLPVVTSDLQTFTGIFHDGEQGFKVSLSEEEFVERLTQLWSDQGMRARMGESAMLTSRSFGRSAMVEHYMSLYGGR